MFRPSYQASEDALHGQDLFTSIGHKAKKDVMHNPLPDDDLVPPPSYDSLAIELCTTSQIHEIDSVEIPSVEPPRRAQPSRVRTYLQSPKPTLQPEPSPFFDTALPESVPSCVIPAELDNSLMNPACHDSTVMTWINDPAAYIPFEFPAGDRRSIISIGSHMGDDRRAKTRSKTLAPSSSLRSNASMDLDSPMSNLLCQPAYEIDSLHPTPPFGTPLDGDLILPDVISELPADTPFSSIPNVPDDLLESAALFTLETCDDEPALCHTLADLSKPLAPEVNVLPYSTGAASSLAAHEPSRTDPSSLITAAWETLLAHISSSKTKLQHLRTNPLALLFLSTEPQDIAASGHAALARILDGNAPSSPFELLCFVHVAYSYFLVLHEDDAPLFLTIFLLKPPVIPAALQWHLRKNISRLPAPYGNPTTLNQLEHSLLSRAGSETLQGLASELWTTHLKEASLLSRVNDPTFSISVGLTVNAVRQKFVHVPGLSATLLSVNNLLLEGQIATVRRAELELLQAASHSLPPATFLKEYSPFVRRHFDALYADTSLGSAPRAIYYLHAIRLVESAFTSASPKHLMTSATC
ncbi:unnamed protein product [Parascedosporium putredinis]|uniref:Uncharacterized protein n=1 Tax=Parascedosporium putredinis TaxID=1442378 RepID=A0A9P1GWR3_9PEZI|nr:unnamed protein product [Parascedosporium putredinis]CAI7988420.1 unnamed protein product [Parascedosporium putredinis]